MKRSDYIIEHKQIPSENNALGKELHYYLIQGHKDCLVGTDLSARLMREYANNRSNIYANRLEGLYEPGEIKPHEESPDAYFALLVDENERVISGARIEFSADHKKLPYREPFGSESLDMAFQDMEKQKAPLRYAEYGGVFTLPEYAGGKGLAKLTGDHLYEFVRSQAADIIFLCSFSDVIQKYVNWAQSLGMKQMYLMPANNLETGMLLIQSPHDQSSLDLPQSFDVSKVSYLDSQSSCPSNIVQVAESIGRAVHTQQQAALKSTSRGQ